MKVLLLNQAFYPDPVSTAQHLTDLAVALGAEGHQVTVLTSARGYDDPLLKFPARETWKGVDIIRIPSVPMGKTTRWRRAIGFGSYSLWCALRMVTLGGFDVVVSLTSPPLISVLGALFAKLKGGRFVFWVMDLNPDEAIAAGWLKPTSMTARLLGRLLRFSLVQADAVVALDRFMADVIVDKGVPRDRLVVLPPWSHEGIVYDEAGRLAFRQRHGWSDRFVVMYAGNHSPCNPLDTVLAAAERLRDRPEVLFCFMGGGSEYRLIERHVAMLGAPNITCIGYQPREELAAALSAADLQVVTLGNEFRGLIHPCKIYNALKVGAPVLYVGPEPSHVTEIIRTITGESGWMVRHGDVEGVVTAILDASAGRVEMSREWLATASVRFDAAEVLPEIVRLVVKPQTPAAEPILERL